MTALLIETRSWGIIKAFLYNETKRKHTLTNGAQAKFLHGKEESAEFFLILFDKRRLEEVS